MVIGESRLKDIGRFFIWFCLRYLILILPPPTEIKMNALLGRVSYYFLLKKRRLLRRNLIAVLGRRSDIDELVRLNLENHFIDQYLIFSFPKLRPENIGRYITFEGIEHINKALKGGRGVIIVHGHFGPRLLSLFALGLMGYKVNQIEGPIAEGLSIFGHYCARQKIALEKRIPANIISSQKLLRPAFVALHNNQILFMAGDGMGGRRFLGHQCPVDFLGHRLRFPAGPVSLANRTGATLLPLFTIRQKSGIPYKATIGEPLPVRYGRFQDEELTYYTEKFVLLLEENIKIYPYLWHFWDEFYYRTVDKQMEGLNMSRSESKGSPGREAHGLLG